MCTGMISLPGPPALDRQRLRRLPTRVTIKLTTTTITINHYIKSEYQSELYYFMFCPLPLFRQLSCTAPRCTRVNCPFTHGPVKAISLPGDQLNLLGTSSPSRALHDAGTTSATASSSSSRGPDKTMIDIRGHEKAISAKRAGSPSLMETRPAKVQKVNSPIRIVQPPPSTSSGPNKSSVSISTSNVSQSSLASGPPVLNATPATSKVPLATRQALLTNLYSAFKSLYQSFHDQHPEFAYNHAIEQEKEIHGKTNKITYKNVSHLFIYL